MAQPQLITVSSVILSEVEEIEVNFENEKLRMGRHGMGLTNHIADMRKAGEAPIKLQLSNIFVNPGAGIVVYEFTQI